MKRAASHRTREILHKIWLQFFVEFGAQQPAGDADDGSRSSLLSKGSNYEGKNSRLIPAIKNC